MKKARRGHRKQENKDPGDDKEARSKSKSKSFAWISKDKLLVATTVAGIAYLVATLLPGGFQSPFAKNNVYPFKAEDFVKSTALTVEERLMEEWPTGGLVTLKSGEEGGRGLVATRNIQKGQIVARVRYPDLERQIHQEHPVLRRIVEKAVETAVLLVSGTIRTTVTTAKIMSLIKFLLEDSRGSDSILQSFIESLPKNVTNMAWYWSESEKKCVVPRPNALSIDMDLHVYHTVMAEVKDKFEPLAAIYTKEKAEWAYLMHKVYSFGPYWLPVLHLANHNALKAIPVFLIPSADMAVYVATQNMSAGDPVYASYGTLTPVASAEQYGFVEHQPAYFEVPSILEELMTAEKTKNEPLCTEEPIRFFGDVTEQIVGAKFQTTERSTYFKAFMPDERSYACIRVLLQTERDTDVAMYISEKLEIDLERYSSMVNAEHCQSSEGNMPLIRQANLATARLLDGALKVAMDGRDWKIPYPDIPTYVKNN
jgi:SET domain